MGLKTLPAWWGDGENHLGFLFPPSRSCAQECHVGAGHLGGCGVAAGTFAEPWDAAGGFRKEKEGACDESSAGEIPAEPDSRFAL